MPWVPVIDEEFIPDAPIDLLESGRMNQKDILMGVNKDEGTAFVGTFLSTLKHPNTILCV